MNETKTKTEIKTYTEEEWVAEGVKLFGEDARDWRFQCPSCGHVQNGHDMIAANVEKPESTVYFSCIGRWLPDTTGTMGNKEQPCNYTLGGLFKINKAELLREDGDITPVFEFEKPETE